MHCTVDSKGLVVSWRMQQNLQVTDGTKWNNMDKDGTRWNKYCTNRRNILKMDILLTVLLQSLVWLVTT